MRSDEPRPSVELVSRVIDEVFRDGFVVETSMELASRQDGPPGRVPNRQQSRYHTETTPAPHLTTHMAHTTRMVERNQLHA